MAYHINIVGHNKNLNYSLHFVLVMDILYIGREMLE